MPTENWRRKSDWNKRPFPLIGVLAFVVLVAGTVTSLLTWSLGPVIVSVGLFIILAAWDAWRVGQGK